MNALSGVLLIDKPIGLTSFDVVARVRRRFKIKRVGHTGTLDPFASGLLVVCLGQATRLVPYLTDQRKTYRATLRLGSATDTLDCTGQELFRDPEDRLNAVSEEQISDSLSAFRGTIQQRPPIFSAIHIDGERAYEKARRGEEVDLPLREVCIHRLDLLQFQFPDVVLEIDCSKGTYIRSLGADIAESLHLHGHLTALRRLQSGPFDVKSAITLDALQHQPDVEAHLLSPADALSHWPTFTASPKDCVELSFGRMPPFSPQQAGLHRVLDEEGHLVALVDVSDEMKCHSMKVFLSTSGEA